MSLKSLHWLADQLKGDSEMLVKVFKLATENESDLAKLDCDYHDGLTMKRLLIHALMKHIQKIAAQTHATKQDDLILSTATQCKSCAKKRPTVILD